MRANEKTSNVIKKNVIAFQKSKNCQNLTAFFRLVLLLYNILLSTDQVETNHLALCDGVILCISLPTDNLMMRQRIKEHLQKAYILIE